MALRKDYFVERFGVTLSNCYWKFSPDFGIRGGKNLLSCEIHCYKDKATADTNTDDVISVRFEFVPDLDIM